MLAESLRLAGQVWTPVTYEELMCVFLRAEAHTISPPPDPRLLLAPNFADARENAIRQELLWPLRGALLKRVPRSTRWYRVGKLERSHLEELLVIGRCGWDACEDQNELAAVARRRPHALSTDPGAWPPLILWGHSQAGPFTILEGNHRLVALASTTETTPIGAEVLIGLSEEVCYWHLPDKFPHANAWPCAAVNDQDSSVGKTGPALESHSCAERGFPLGVNPMVETKARTWQKIGIFYALTLLLSAPFWYLCSYGGDVTLVTGLMWSPALAAVFTKWIFRENLRDLGWRWGGSRYRLRGYLIPLLCVAAVYVPVWITGLGGLNAVGYVQSVAKDFGLAALPAPLACVAYILLALTAGFIAKGGRAMGEEIGWRGFLVPELWKVTGFTGLGLISGVMWAVWHYPLILFSDYNAGTPAWFAITCFTVMITAMGFIAAWLRLRSGSVWPAVFLHASLNMSIQLIFTPMTTNTGKTAYLIDEFGIGLAITSVIGAIVVWTKRDELPAAGSGRRESHRASLTSIERDRQAERPPSNVGD